MAYPVDIPRCCILSPRVSVDRELDIARCADGGPPPSSPTAGWSGLCPRPDRRRSAAVARVGPGEGLGARKTLAWFLTGSFSLKAWSREPSLGRAMQTLNSSGGVA
eukprot:6180954-Pleurochrysis_carterae.AAC.1